MSADDRPKPTTADQRAREDKELYDLAPCALLSTLPTGEIVRANQTLFEWLRASREQVLGKLRFQALLTVGSRIYYETHYGPLLQMQGFVSEIALEIRRLDGEVRPVIATARQDRDANGSAVMVHVALFDSSDRRRYEKELLEARRHADAASRELEAVDRKKNEFIAILAHELRNPLAPIRAAVELQRRRDSADHVVNKTSQMMQRQVGQMVRLVEDLLDVTRIAENKLKVRLFPVDLASVVHHAIEANEPLLKNAGLRLETILPRSPLYAEVDAARLVQVISNILNNATKFTPREGVVSLALEANGHEALIKIRDTGVGIAAEKLSRIFDMFMQADASDRSDGLGIGLTLAKNLVERHGGQISVTSEGEGFGTEFTIHLPTLRETPQSVSPTVATARSVTVLRRRLLVVDDNVDSAEMMKLLLEFEGHEVMQVHDGLAAVEAASSFQPDAVFLDIGLPKLDGYQVAQRIRARGGVQPVIVALTGWGQDADRERTGAAGFDAHLIKPVDHEELTRLIADLPRQV